MKPTQGKPYTTVQGDTLESISAQAFADPTQATLILNVNPMQITVGVSEQLPTGTSLIIPIDTDLENLRTQQLQNGLVNTK